MNHLTPWWPAACRGLVAVLVVGCWAAVCSAADPPGSPPVKGRTFRFTYAATVTGLPAGDSARVWLPVPSADADQDVEILAKDVPAGARLTRERQHGNRMLYVEAKPGPDGALPLSLTYRITRREVRGERPGPDAGPQQEERYLGPDALVPTTGKPLQLLEGKALPAEQTAAARVLYDVVNAHLRYSKHGKGWGRGDAVWACESGYGNCTDFHSLFIALARSRRIPAKFEIGFGLPPGRGAGEVAGYHCWAEFRPAGKGWVPVDISEANKEPARREYYFGNLTEDRVLFSVGRDLLLEPPQAGPRLNFFIYPYVEVGGEAAPRRAPEAPVLVPGRDAPRALTARGLGLTERAGPQPTGLARSASDGMEERLPVACAPG